MVKKVNYSKLAIVIFLTVLIWFWADRSLEEEYSIPNATIVMGRTRPELWVSFPNGSTIDVNEITLTGPASIVNEFIQTINNDPDKLKFIFSPERLGIDKAGEYQIDVQDIIEQSNWIKKSGLTIEKCDPKQIQVNAVDFVRQNDLQVKCFDESDLPINLENSVTISMYVPADWREAAKVVLSDNEIARAILQPISKKPFIILANNEKREADSFVEIKLPPQENILKRYSINNATLGYTLSETILKGQYDIKVENQNLRDILNIQILATPKAKEAYENQDYQITLEILDGDVEETIQNKLVRRKVYYKFPEEFVRTNEIKLDGERLEARFTVTPKETIEDSP